MTSMQEFLNTGRLGAIELGMSPEEVEGVLGSPEDRSVRRTPVLLLLHGALELTFKPAAPPRGSTLVSIGIYFGPSAEAIPPAIRPSDWTPTHETSEEEFRELLCAAHIPVHSSVQGEQDYLVLDSGASAVFAGGKLHSLHFKRRVGKAERRQVTLSLPEESAKMLKRRAREQHTSIHELVERMIKESA